MKVIGFFQRTYLSCLVCLSLSALSRPGAAETASDKLFEPASVAQLDHFIDSIRSNVTLDTPRQHSNQQIDGLIAGLWAGSTTKVESKFGALTLRFRPKTEALLALGDQGDASGKKLLESFEIVITPQDGRLRVEHSAVADKKRDGFGFYARIDRVKDLTRIAVVQGQKQSGVYMAIPASRDPINNWGIFICPREFPEQASVGSRELQLKPSSYELSEAAFSLEANATATLATAGQKGRVLVRDFISPGLPPGKVERDEAISTLPTAGVLYAPSVPFDFFRFAPFQDVQQGIVTLVEMQNVAGYTRRQYFSHQRFIHKTNEPTPISIVINRRELKNDSGECYVVVEQRYNWMEYGKQQPTF